MWSNVPYAARVPRKSTRFTATVLLTLALGIGATRSVAEITKLQHGDCRSRQIQRWNIPEENGPDSNWTRPSFAPAGDGGHVTVIYGALRSPGPGQGFHKSGRHLWKRAGGPGQSWIVAATFWKVPLPAARFPQAAASADDGDYRVTLASCEKTKDSTAACALYLAGVVA